MWKHSIVMVSASLYRDTVNSSTVRLRRTNWEISLNLSCSSLHGREKWVPNLLGTKYWVPRVSLTRVSPFFIYSFSLNSRIIPKSKVELKKKKIKSKLNYNEITELCHQQFFFAFLAEYPICPFFLKLLSILLFKLKTIRKYPF